MTDERDARAGAETVRVATTNAPAPSTDGERYVLVERIGEGGMGVVWAARDRALDRTVALKVLHDRFVGSGPQERLASEARAMARLSHRNVVAVYDVGEREGRTYITMELVRGRHLGHWLETPRSWREVLAVIRAAGAGLVAAHEAGIIHRDVKPSNILIADSGEVRVADFGVASASAPPLDSSDPTVAATHGFIGTPAYMSPERLRGEPADARGDQFALCATLYEALHGRRPFVGETIAALHEAIDRGCPPPVRRVPRWLHAAIARGLSADPDDRFPSIAHLLDALAPRRGKRIAIAAVVVAAAAASIVIVRFRHAPDPASTVDERVIAEAQRPLTGLGGCAYSPAFADDNTVVFDYTIGDSVDLFRVSTNGGEPTRVTSEPGWEWRATSGRRSGDIAYIATPMVADGKTAVRFANAHDGTVSDRIELETSSIAVAGDALYYVDGGSEYIRRREGTRDEIVGHTRFAESQIAVSAQGSIAVVGKAPNDRPRLCLGDSDGSQTCFDERVRESRPAFRADAKVLYVPRYDGIARLELARRSQTLLLPGAQAGGGVAISPDARLLVWSTCWLSGVLVELTASPWRTVTAYRGARQPVTGAGGRLAWIEEGPSPRVVVREKDGAVVEVLAGWDLSGPVSFDARGDRIAFAATGEQHGIYVTAGQGLSNPTLVAAAAGDMNPMWTADGRIAFTRLDERRVAHVYVVSPEGGTAVRMRSSRTTLSVRFSTNELLVATPTGMAWFDVENDTERPLPLPDVGPIASASVSPGGRWLAFAAGKLGSGNEIWRLRLDASPAVPERVASLASDQSMQGSVTIDDEGRVFGVPMSWRGELFVVPLAR